MSALRSKREGNVGASARLKRICLVTSALGAGGAERVLSTLANWWAAQGHLVTLVTLSDDRDDFYSLDDRIERIALGVTSPSRRPHEAVFQNLRRIRALRQAIVTSQPDVVISFIDTVNVLTVIATRWLGVLTIVSERVDPRAHPIGRPWTVLRTLAYARACAVVVQTRSVAEWMMQAMHLRRCVVIPNPLSPALAKQHEAVTVCNEEGPGRVLMAMGRLVEQKGFDLLLDAFASAGGRKSGWRLVIIGEGPQREALQERARALGISDVVEFAGRIDRPDALLKTADIFVLPSRYEGFPNALLEAMSLGVACVAFDCRSGPADIIRDGMDGVLVPPEDVRALSTTIEALMRDDYERLRLAARAREVRERFSIERIATQWDALIDDAAESIR